MIEKATFAAGGFWSVEETFRRLPGVVATAVGYMGGSLENPRYEDVCTGLSGHVEVVQLDFDSTHIAYAGLLAVFWHRHDPTTLIHSNPTLGSQHRSVIFHHSEPQKAAAELSKATLELSRSLRHPIVTEILPATTFWRAEEYHQRYLEKHGLLARRA